MVARDAASTDAAGDISLSPIIVKNPGAPTSAGDDSGDSAMGTAPTDAITDSASDATGANEHAAASAAGCAPGLLSCEDSCVPNDCNGTCTNVVTDNNNCGACSTASTSHACPAGTQCSGGQCQCTTAGLSLCGVACVDETSDSTNCGACGHNCQGGLCVSGNCQPKLIALGFNGGSLAIGIDSVYVVDYGSGGRLLRIAKSSGTITPLASGSIWDTAVFGGSLYWTTSTAGGTDGRVTRAALDGNSPQDIATGQATASELFVDGSGAYWLVGNGATDGAVMRRGPTDSAPVAFASMLPRPNSIAGDTNNIYWLTIGAVGDGSDGAVYATPKSGGGIVLIAPMQHNATGSEIAITAFEGTVYWDPRGLGTTDGAVRSSLPTAGAMITEFANNQARPQGIAVDGSSVYWIDYGNGTDGLLQKASLTTKAVTQLAGSLANPHGLGLDGSVLYFTTQGNSTTPGGLYRLVL